MWQRDEELQRKREQVREQTFTTHLSSKESQDSIINPKVFQRVAVIGKY